MASPGHIKLIEKLFLILSKKIETNHMIMVLLIINNGGRM